MREGPTAYPVEQHIHRLFAHVVYGMATTSMAQTLFRSLDGNSGYSPFGFLGRYVYSRVSVDL